MNEEEFIVPNAQYIRSEHNQYDRIDYNELNYMRNEVNTMRMEMNNMQADIERFRTQIAELQKYDTFNLGERLLHKHNKKESSWQQQNSEQLHSVA